MEEPFFGIWDGSFCDIPNLITKPTELVIADE
jgi:hypothetical protein